MGNKSPVVSINDLEFKNFSHGEKFSSELSPLGPLLGMQKLGCRVVKVSPGKRAWPYHFHYVNEELFFVLEGEGQLRYDDQEYAVKKGDFIAAPPGANSGHQIINDSNNELVYLAISTMESTDVFEYPDSGKFGVFSGAAPGARPKDGEKERDFAIFSPKDSGVDYWEGE